MQHTIKERFTRFLLWSQRYTRADMLYLANGGFWLGFSQTATSIISFVLLLAFANLLSKETFGIYRYILSLASMLNVFALTGMSAAVTRSVAAGNDNALRNAVRYQLKWSVLMFLAFFVLSGFYFVKDNLIFALSFFTLGIFTPLTLIFNTYGAYLNGKKEFRLASMSSILSTLVFASGVFLAIFLSGEILWLIFAYSMSTFISAAFFYAYTLYTFKPAPANHDREALEYGRELSLIGLIGPIVSQIDKIVLAQFWGPAQLATYSLAVTLPSKAVPYLKKFVSLGSPKFAQKTIPELNSVFYRRILQGMLVGAVVAVVYIAISPVLFKYLLPQYLDGVRYSQLLAVSFIFAMPTRYIGLLFESQKMSTQILINTLINSTLAVVLYVLLGIWGGIWGLTVAFVLWSFIGMLVNLITWKISSRPRQNSTMH